MSAWGWADKFAALAAYFRQAEDHEFYAIAQRINGRAVRRCGELLKTLDGRPQNAAKQKDGDGLLISRTEAGASVGMSKRQIKTAVRVASIPPEQFEAVIESEKPPSISALARMGTTTRGQPIAPTAENAKQSSAANHAMGAMMRRQSQLDIGQSRGGGRSPGARRR